MARSRRGLVTPVTVTGAVSPAACATVAVPAPAEALFGYVPGVEDTITSKCRDTEPEAGTFNGPARVRV